MMQRPQLDRNGKVQFVQLTDFQTLARRAQGLLFVFDEPHDTKPSKEECQGMIMT